MKSCSQAGPNGTSATTPPATSPRSKIPKAANGRYEYDVEKPPHALHRRARGQLELRMVGRQRPDQGHRPRRRRKRPHLQRLRPAADADRSQQTQSRIQLGHARQPAQRHRSARPQNELRIQQPQLPDLEDPARPQSRRPSNATRSATSSPAPPRRPQNRNTPTTPTACSTQVTDPAEGVWKIERNAMERPTVYIDPLGQESQNQLQRQSSAGQSHRPARQGNDLRLRPRQPGDRNRQTPRRGDLGVRLRRSRQPDRAVLDPREQRNDL